VEPQKQVSHETIYRSLFIQARGMLKKELLEHLRARRTVCRSRHASMKRNGLGQIKNAVSISERPPSVEDRAVPGHWEGDLIGGSGNSYVATLVERHSRYVMLVKVANKDTESAVSALIKQSQHWPPRSMSIFVILGLPGSAGQTKTPTDCCASIFHVAPICPCTATARPSLRAIAR
jgi:IS30 family transposase